MFCLRQIIQFSGAHNPEQVTAVLGLCHNILSLRTSLFVDTLKSTISLTKHESCLLRVMGSWIPLPDLLSMFLKRLLEKLPDLLSRFYFFVKPCKTHYLLDTNYHPYLLMFWSLEMGSICISSCASYITQFTAISIWWKRFFLFLLCCLFFLLVFLAFQVFPVSLNIMISKVNILLCLSDINQLDKIINCIYMHPTKDKINRWPWSSMNFICFCWERTFPQSNQWKISA